MKRTIAILFSAGWLAAAAQAQLTVNLDHLAAKATEAVDVSLDAAALQLAGKFLSAQKAADAKLKDTVSKLKRIQVRKFEFADEGMYSQADLNPVREQLKAPGWTRIVHVQEKRESVEIYIKTEQNQTAGLAILACEPREVAFVHLDGPVSLEELTSLGGQFGIPDFSAPAGRKKTGK